MPDSGPPLKGQRPVNQGNRGKGTAAKLGLFVLILLLVMLNRRYKLFGKPTSDSLAENFVPAPAVPASPPPDPIQEKAFEPTQESVVSSAPVPVPAIPVVPIPAMSDPIKSISDAPNSPTPHSIAPDLAAPDPIAPDPIQTETAEPAQERVTTPQESPDPARPAKVVHTVKRPVKRPVKRGNSTAVNLGIFVLTFGLALGGGYLLFNKPAPAPVTASTPTATAPATDHSEHTTSAANPADTPTPATPAASAEGEIFTKRGCVGCHSVSALGVQGGVTGPDLSHSFVNVPDKQGIPIEDFLKKPTSAVMSGVLGGNPLTDDERAQVLAALKAASEK